RVQKFLQLLEFLNQRFIDFLPACGVENVNVWSGAFDSTQDRLRSCLSKCCRYRALNIFLVQIRCIDWNINLFPERYKLLDRRRALQIARDQRRAMTLCL